MFQLQNSFRSNHTKNQKMACSCQWKDGKMELIDYPFEKFWKRLSDYFCEGLLYEQVIESSSCVFLSVGFAPMKKLTTVVRFTHPEEKRMIEFSYDAFSKVFAALKDLYKRSDEIIGICRSCASTRFLKDEKISIRRRLMISYEISDGDVKLELSAQFVKNLIQKEMFIKKWIELFTEKERESQRDFFALLQLCKQERMKSLNVIVFDVEKFLLELLNQECECIPMKLLLEICTIFENHIENFIKEYINVYYRNKEKRLQSYDGLPQNWPFDKKYLASLGYYLSGQNQITCAYCEMSFYEWEINMDFEEVHQKYARGCTFYEENMEENDTQS